ncbi:delta-60 repeat domain-containing protein [Deinococcus sp. AJ005]|uniref:delta-60 repeat domain-containing protein n=1 Tax=Deinococcus sp. AJ005 TaxID=2652443 RepID=UPI0018657530|nr:delta-60 repeat domain-containing protein [Deinococcus sp. AJ005]
MNKTIKAVLAPALLLSTALILASCAGNDVPVAVAVAVTPPDAQIPLPDPRTQNSCVDNLLQNPNAAQFTAGSSTNISPLGPTVVPGWASAAGSPQHSPTVGYDSAPGWLLAWGYKDGGESFAQSGLSLTPGTYTLKLGLRAFSTTVANYSKYTINFGNSVSTTPWTIAAPTIVSGSIPVNSPSLPWVPQSHTFTIGVGGATTMQVTTVNDNASAQVNGHPELVSWMGYDGFCLQKVNPVKPINLHHANSVRVLPNGNTVMVGSADAVGSLPGADPDFATVMYGPAGNVLWSDVRHLSNVNDEATDVAVDKNGNIVVVGVKNRSIPTQVYDDSGAVMFKYGPTGTLLDSVTVDNPNTQDWFQSVEIDQNNNIVTGGTDNTQTVSSQGGAGNWRAFKVRRYLSVPTLPLDTTFNAASSTPGMFNLSINSFFNLEDYAASLSDVAIQPDGKILAAGTTRVTELGNVNVSAILRLNGDGTLDTSYGVGGVQTVGYNPSVVGTGNPSAMSGSVSSVFNRILLQDNKAVMAGHVIFGSPDDVCTVTRLDVNGKLDATFGTGGVTLIKQAQCKGIASDGKMLALTGPNFQAFSANDSDVLDARLVATNGALSSVAPGVNDPNTYGPVGRVDVGTNVAYDPTTSKYVFSGFTNKAGTDDEWFSPLLRR